MQTKLPYFGLFVVSLVCVLAFVATKDTSGESLNAWGYVSLSMQLVFSDVGLIFIAIFSAMLIAEETGFGTARTVLATSISRWEFYVAKVLMGLFYASVLSITSLGISICLGLVNYQFGDVTDTMGLIYGQKEVLGNFILAFFLSWIPLAAVVTYGIFISTIINKPGQAVAVTMGTIYVIDFTKHIIGIDSYIFTRYIGFSWRIFNQITQGIDYQWYPEVWKMMITSLIYCFVAFFTGLAIFIRRDLNN